MRSTAAGALALAALAVGSAATATAMAVQNDDARWPGRHMTQTSQMSHLAVDSEHEFLAEMVAHHEEAIGAAGELARSDRAEMRAFGARIVESQSAQVEQMQTWLDTWYPDRSGEIDYEDMMRDLTQLSGDDLDEAFLADMIGHHMGAVMMSQQLIMRDLADHAPVERLAVDIRDEQLEEIRLMQRWLRDWFDSGWGGPGGHMMFR